MVINILGTINYCNTIFSNGDFQNATISKAGFPNCIINSLIAYSN